MTTYSHVKSSRKFAIDSTLVSELPEGSRGNPMGKSAALMRTGGVVTFVTPAMDRLLSDVIKPEYVVI